MTLAISQSAALLAPSRGAAFGASGGTAPYVFSVAPGGAGGTVDAATGVYTAPGVFGSDTVVVTDAALATASATIAVVGPLDLVCEIVQRGLGLANGRVYIWDQKLNRPTDSGLYVAVSVPMAKPFGSVSRLLPNGDEEQWAAMLATVDFDIISKTTEALDRKEEILLALGSMYSQRQQAANGFSIARLTGRFLNLSAIDGAAIPYRYRISVNVQYAFSKSQAGGLYYDTFEREVITGDGATADTATLVSGGDAPSPPTDVIDGGDANTTLSE